LLYQGSFLFFEMGSLFFFIKIPSAKRAFQRLFQVWYEVGRIVGYGVFF